MPKLSVVLPVYNSEKYVKEAIDSIINQTFTDFELLLINDASTDGSLHVIEQYEDPRIRIINNEVNLKVVKSLNKGLSLARGEFIARMDADDVAHPRRFEKQLDYFNKHPEVDLCGSWVQTFGSESKILKAATEHEHIKARLLFLNPMFHPAIMFRRESFERHNLRYDEEFTNAEDYGLWVNAIDKIRFGNVPEILLKYRVHDTNVSVLKESNKKVLDEIHFSIFSHFLDKLKLNYSEDELWMQRKLGLVDTGHLTFGKFNEYLQWLKKLVVANNSTAYFDKKHFRNVIISFILYLIRQTKSPIRAAGIAVAMFSGLYGYQDCFKFFSDRAKVRFAKAASF